MLISDAIDTILTLQVFRSCFSERVRHVLDVSDVLGCSREGREHMEEKPKMNIQNELG
jgi:hypothetical protein